MSWKRQREESRNWIVLSALRKKQAQRRLLISRLVMLKISLNNESCEEVKAAKRLRAHGRCRADCAPAGVCHDECL